MIRNHDVGETLRGMHTAMQASSLAFEEGYLPIGISAYLDGEFIGIEHNKCEYDNKTRNEHFSHPEWALIDRLTKERNSDLSKISLFTTLEPCIECIKKMCELNAKMLCYGARDLNFGGLYLFDREFRKMCSLNRDSYFSVIHARDNGLIKQRFLNFCEYTKNEFWSTRQNPANRFLGDFEKAL
jgi:tRNA(Arg) A34 adenosine deaminase TadA